MPIPKCPVYVPPELMDLLRPPPPSGLPFNAQLHKSDIERGYMVPTHYPQPLMAELESEVDNNPDLRAVKEAYEEFIGVLKRATVRVVPPSDQILLERIHKTIEYVIKEGPVFEAIIIARENKNPDYRFLCDNKGHEHIYYRWKLFSILNGDGLYEWRTREFRMFENGSLWKPPPLNPFEDGMPEELINRSGIATVDKVSSDRPVKCQSNTLKDDLSAKDTLSTSKREVFNDLLQNLEPKKVSIGTLMMFCIDHADAAGEIMDCIQESLGASNIPLEKELARLFLISDILNNCSAAVTNASLYREGFQAKLVNIFECLRKYLENIQEKHEADKFKQKILSVLGAWREWTLYENDFLVRLSNILLGVDCDHHNADHIQLSEVKLPEDQTAIDPTNLDGTEVDEETLSKCLEAKGLSLRWYMTLELSEDEDDDSFGSTTNRSLVDSGTRATSSADASSDQVIKFKSSKWETLDPSEVAGQVVTISKWEAMAKAEEEGYTDSSSPPSSAETSPIDPGTLRLRRKRESGQVNSTNDEALVDNEQQQSSKKLRLDDHDDDDEEEKDAESSLVPENS